jgi:SAP domain
MSKEADLSELKVGQLKLLCKRHDLSSEGTKDEIVKRLRMTLGTHKLSEFSYYGDTAAPSSADIKAINAIVEEMRLIRKSQNKPPPPPPVSHSSRK